MEILAIVVTYNGKKWIEKCFRSLSESNIPLSIMAIDNGSSDGTPEIIRNSFSNVEVIETSSNLGFGRANNLGFERALDRNVDFIFLLNQDAWIEKNTVETLVQIWQKNKSFGILSPIHFSGTGASLDRFFSYYLRETNTPSITSDLFLRKTAKIYEAKFVNAACWLISSTCLRRVGSFDPLFPHYGEDVDYVARVYHKNYKVGIVPDSVIYHDRPQDRKIDSNLNLKHKYIDHLITLKNPNSNFWGSLIFLYKHEFDSILTDLLFRRFRQALVRIQALTHLFPRLQNIYKSYNLHKE